MASQLGGAATVTIDRRLVVVADEGGPAKSRFSLPSRVGLSLADAFGVEEYAELEAACRAALAGEEVVLSCASAARNESYLVRLGPRTDGAEGAISLWVDMGQVGERNRAERARGDELRGLWLACRSLARVEGHEAVRKAICEAAIEVAACSSAALFEPLAGARELEMTASVGLELAQLRLPLDELSGATLALRTGGQQATLAGDSQPPGARELMEAGAARSMLWQPISRGRVVDAVICAGYGAGIAQPAARERRVLEALAVEGSMAFERDRRWSAIEAGPDSDLAGGLAGRATFGTSLERELHRAKRQAERLSVAILQLDPASDDAGGLAPVAGRDPAAIAGLWRPRLRGCDLLAHYGPEQFALLLCNCGPRDGARSLERMRELGGPSFHAGLADSDGSDSPELLEQRTLGALERARQAGPGSIHL
ncbi:MAG: hypothetical protein ACR2K6_05750 [Solirubrobacterales bacterium]